ncbi:hypothetical protein BDR04DRAFT_1087601 [Suillus decipiens]|nr:hypothetical protein BDR04DRAFT_1087601 [Suillus decipiens]
MTIFFGQPEGSRRAPLNALEHTPNYLAMSTHPGVPHHRLNLKQNCMCTLQRNPL